MAKSSNQKLKMLYLLQILNEESDEKHPIPMRKILEKLQARGVSAERKSIYDDVEMLYTYGVEVKKTNKGYYIDDRMFNISELKTLTDAVLAAKFLTHSQAEKMIKKFEKLASVHEAKQLDRHIYIMNENKGSNKSVSYIIDNIYEAINNNFQIEFKYFDLDIYKKIVYRHDGAIYQVSPYALIWDNENYYLLGYSHKDNMIRHYRVDKMDSLNIKEEARKGKEEFDKLNMSTYTNSVFGMYGGNTKKVSIEMENKLIGAVYDKFGKDVSIIKKDKDHFLVHADIVESAQFFGWLFGLSGSVKIVSPPETIEKYKEMARKVIQDN